MPIVVFIPLLFSSCKKEDNNSAIIVNEDLFSYTEIASINLGAAGAAEITSYDEVSKRLFAVNNGSVNKVDVIDLANPSLPVLVQSINLSSYGGFANSIVAKAGKVFIAIEAANKQGLGSVIVFDTKTLAELKTITVGALPDMITISPDQRYVLTANEGEPSSDYLNDPEGTLSIIDIQNNYAVRTINFSSQAAAETGLKANGFRIFGPSNSFVKDIEPEYITVSEDSKTAWVTLQENNGIAEVDIVSGTIKGIMPLGFKNYNSGDNFMDLSDRDNAISFTNPWPVFGIYMPDAISNMSYQGDTYLFTANEGDAREYNGFNEIKRIKDISLDATKFPDAATLKTDSKIGRLNITSTLGDTDNDGDFDQLFSFGARSFSVWNARTKALVWDSKNDLDIKAQSISKYDDGRSDDKGAEPEAVTIGKVGDKTVAYIGLERADAIAIYDVSNPLQPKFIKIIATGDAPEGVLFISSKESPIGQSLIVVASENDGNVKIYKANKL